MSSATRSRAPGAFIAVRIMMSVQGALTVLAVVFISTMIADSLGHGQEVPTIVYASTVLSAVLGVLLLIVAGMLGVGKPWVRPTATVLEVVVVVIASVNIASGVVASAIGLVLAVIVMVLLYRNEVGDWMNVASTAHTDAPLTRQ